MPQNIKFCGIRVFIGAPFYLCSPSNVCTILSAACPSQRSGKCPFCHSPLFRMSRASARISEFSPTSRFVPIVTVSGCSAYVLNVMQGIPKKEASSATLPESVMIPQAWFTKYPNDK